MRAWGACVAVALCGAAHGQSGWAMARDGYKVLADKGLIVAPVRPRVGQPQGFPSPEPKEGALPPPKSEDRQLRVLQAGKMHRTGQTLIVEGPAHVQFQGYDIFADRVEADLESEVFFLQGKVRLIGVDSVVTGDTVQVRFKEKTFRATEGEVELRPSFTKGKVLDDLYLGGKLTFGSEREAFASDSYFTTCDRDHPHYRLNADHTVIRPGKRAILRDVKFEVLGRTVLTLPYVSIPLEDYSDRYLPDVGQSRDEGYYVRTVTGVPMRSASTTLDARVDYYTKLGGGLGGNYQYAHEDTSGSIKLFGLTGGPGTLEASNQHRQKFGALTLDISNDYHQHNYLSNPDGIQLSTRGSLLYQQGRSTTRLSYQRSSNESPGFSYGMRSTGLSDQRTWTSKLRTTLDVNLVANQSSFSSGTPTEREQLDVRFRGTQDLVRATAELEYVRSIPVGETTNFFSASDRTPVLTLKSTSQQMFGRNHAGLGFPFQTQLSMGEYVDARSRDRLSRGAFEFAFQRPDKSKERLTVDVDGRLKQGIYSDDTAQYVVGMGANVRYKLGADTGVNVRYNYLRPFGFTPLQIDRSGEYHQLGLDVNYRPTRSLLLGAQTGYDLLDQDFTTTPWQSVGVRTEFEPTKWLLFRAFSTYDTFQQGWSNVRMDLAYKPGSTFVRATARYDGIRHTWGQVGLSILDLKWGRLQASTDLVYNGYLKQFEARHFDFRYDLHCAEAVLQIIDNPLGFRSGREIQFFIRFKAFPFDTPFGTGRRGQSVGGGTGRDF